MADVVGSAWQELCERDDRTSPEEYPDMCLITQQELAEFMSRARLSQAGAGGVVVKPLKWQQASDVAAWADTPFGEYRAYKDGAWKGPHYSDSGAGDARSLASGKAAAQADYEARILAALAPSPSAGEPAAEMTSAMMDAGQRYIDRVAYSGTHILPAQFRWTEFWSEIMAAAPTPPATPVQPVQPVLNGMQAIKGDDYQNKDQTYKTFGITITNAWTNIHGELQPHGNMIEVYRTETVRNRILTLLERHGLIDAPVQPTASVEAVAVAQDCAQWLELLLQETGWQEPVGEAHIAASIARARSLTPAPTQGEGAVAWRERWQGEEHWTIRETEPRLSRPNVEVQPLYAHPATGEKEGRS